MNYVDMMYFDSVFGAQYWILRGISKTDVASPQRSDEPGELYVAETGLDYIQEDPHENLESHSDRVFTVTADEENVGQDVPKGKAETKKLSRPAKASHTKKGKHQPQYESDGYIKDYSQTNQMVAGALLDLLRETQPEPGKPLSVGFIRSRIEAFRKYLAASKNVRHEWNNKFKNSRQRGIMIAAGRAGAIINSFVVLHTLRHGTNCTLPVVIAHFGDDEFKKTTKTFFKTLYADIEFLDLKEELYPEHHIPLEVGGNRREFGYKLKVFSIYAAPFREMIFLDSDSVPLQDPSKLFAIDAYKKHSNIFWNDFWKDPVQLWQVLHLQNDPWINFEMDRVHDDEDDDLLSYSAEDDIKNMWERETAARASMKYPFEAESGQIVIDRVKYWEVLEWLMFLNTHDSFVYRYSMGDKDTFRVAFEIAGISDQYYASRFSPALPLVDLGEDGEQKTDPSVRYRCLGMLQLHPENGSPFFHHRTADSKFHPQENPKEYLSAITHVTPPITQDQASIMNWGNPGYSIFQAAGRVTWGLNSKSVFLTKCKGISAKVENYLATLHEEDIDDQHIVNGKCPCPPLHLHTANKRCMGKDALEIETNPEPVLVIEVPKDNFVYRVSKFEVEAYNAIPFQEGSQ